jgi:hypothetical protein
VSYLNWACKYRAGGTWYTLDDIQSLTYYQGRQWATDPFNAGTGAITLRDPNNWPTPRPAMGRQIRVLPSYGDAYGYGGHITDISINYGMVENADEALITFEGPLSDFGRFQLNAEVIAQDISTTQVGVVGTAASTTGLVVGGSSTCSAQTYTGNALNLVSELMVTEMGRLSEVYNAATDTHYTLVLGRGINMRGFTLNYFFSDIPADWSADYFQYSDIEFKSASENHYTRVTIQPQGLAQQTSGSGRFGLVQESLDYTTTQALSHAEYIKNQYGSQTITPYSVTFDYQSQNTANQGNFAFYLGNFATDATAFLTPIGHLMELKFRGTTYKGVVEGYRVSANPENTRVTYYFSPQDVNAYLIWDEPSPYNTWDNNRWGF